MSYKRKKKRKYLNSENLNFKMKNSMKNETIKLYNIKYLKKNIKKLKLLLYTHIPNIVYT